MNNIISVSNLTGRKEGRFWTASVMFSDLIFCSSNRFLVEARIFTLTFSHKYGRQAVGLQRNTFMLVEFQTVLYCIFTVFRYNNLIWKFLFWIKRTNIQLVIHLFSDLTLKQARRHPETWEPVIFAQLPVVSFSFIESFSMDKDEKHKCQHNLIDPADSSISSAVVLQFN